MILNQIINKVIKSNINPIDIDNYYSVLVPLIKIDGELHLVYEVRSLEIKRQPGEISFPGGQVESGEAFKEAAVRETCEELNIKEKNIEVISELDYITSHNNFIIYPFLGYLNDIKIDSLNYSKDEVAKVFTVPLDFFLKNEPKKHIMKYKPCLHDDFPYHLVQNGKDYKWRDIEYPIYFYEYKKYIIWGLTAKITYNFVNKLK